MSDDEIYYQLALSHSTLSSAALFRVVRAMGSAHAVWHASETALREYLDEKQVEKIQHCRTEIQPEKLFETYQKVGIQVLPWAHQDFPAILKMIHNPPFLLYVRGTLAALNPHTLAIVGTRNFTEYGRHVVEQLVEEIAPYQPTIVSGLAAGIDTLAHQGALLNQLPTVAVFGTGIDKVYPHENEKLSLQIIEAGGALISEYPMGMRGDRHMFPLRNRIIAGLTHGALVVEGDIKSGALITAKYALEENRQIMAVPGNIFSMTSRGPNHLIQQGAMTVINGEDIVHALNWDANPQLKLSVRPLKKSDPGVAVLELDQLSVHEREILTVVGYEPTAFDEIQSRKKEISIVHLQTALTMLELNGLITALPGTKFCRN